MNWETDKKNAQNQKKTASNSYFSIKIPSHYYSLKFTFIKSLSLDSLQSMQGVKLSKFHLKDTWYLD